VRLAMTNNLRWVAGLIICAALLGGAPPVLAQTAAQNWPTRPVRLVHGFIPGGSVDITARLLAAHMSDALGQQVIVDGRPGAGGTTGASIVSRSTPDGYTLFLMASGHATSPALYRSLPYDPVKDFTMVSMVASNPMVVLATPSFPPRTIQELVQAAKAAPGKINFGTGGVGTGMHLAAVLFQARAGIRMNHVPYKGGNAGPVALLAGEVPLLFTTAAGVTNYVEAGRIRALAVTTKKRFVLWPNVPTIAETVVPDFDVLAWYAVAAPANLPAPLTNRVNAVIRETLKRPDVIEKLLSLGAETRPSSPQEAQAFLASEVARWTKVIRDEKIPPQD
jgi:tripartite-type tricarboxylate transporter receptor subunit TctC